MTITLQNNIGYRFPFCHGKWNRNPCPRDTRSREFSVQKYILIDIVNITFPHFMPFYQSEHQIYQIVSFRLLRQKKNRDTKPNNTESREKKLSARESEKGADANMPVGTLLQFAHTQHSINIYLKWNTTNRNIRQRRRRQNVNS